MAKQQPPSRLIIAGTAVLVTHEDVPLSTLRLDPNNPRIRLQLTFAGRKKPATHDDLIELMRAQSGYDALQRQIRIEGGIYDPLIVRHDGRIVEGNTRYAVLTVLEKTPGGAEKWSKHVPVTRLPADIPEKVVQLQMAGYHISGKTKWRAAAQADQVFRLIEESGATVEEVAVATRMAPKAVQQTIDAYKYLIHEVIPELKGASVAEKQDILDSKFSHALELMSRADLESVRQNKAERKKVANLIAHGKIQGAEVRKLRTVLDHPRARQALERDGFKAAKEVLRKADPTGESKVLKAVQKLTETLSDLGQDDLALFREHDEARTSLEALVEAAQNVLAMGKRGVKRRA
jgi:hypothetical protein